MFHLPEKLARRLREAGRIYWFLDFDGTLVPLARRPHYVSLHPDTRTALGRLAAKRGMRLAVISGRPLHEIRQLVSLKGVVYAGNHGLEIRGPGVSFRHPQAVVSRPALRGVLRAWETCAARFRGSWLEDKRLTLTFHYRQVAPSKQAAARTAAAAAVAHLRRDGKIRLTAGKKVLEARPPVEWGKGEALRYLLRKWDYRPGRDLAIAFGDDETDRGAFAAVRKDGLAIFVGRGPIPREANAVLSGPAAVRRFLTAHGQSGKDPHK